MSAQQAELFALQLALQMFPTEDLNIYTDSCYVDKATVVTETAPYMGPPSAVQRQLQQVQLLIWARKHPVFVGHLRGHTELPGPLAEGNKLADHYTQGEVLLGAMNVQLFPTVTAYDNALQFIINFMLMLRPCNIILVFPDLRLQKQFPPVLYVHHLFMCLRWVSILENLSQMSFGRPTLLIFLALDHWPMCMCQWIPFLI